MNDRRDDGPDDLLERVGRAVQRAEEESALHNTVWEELAAGTLSDEELAALKAEARDDEAFRWGMTACRPIPADRRAALVQRIQSDLGHAAPRSRRTGRKVGLAWLGAGAGALAAGLIATLWIGSGREPALPIYTLEFSGGDVGTRSGTAAQTSADLGFDSVVEIVLRPQRAPDAPVDLHILAVDARSVVHLPAQFERSPHGAFSVYGEVGRVLGVPEGRWDLAFCVGPPERVAQLRSLVLLPSEVSTRVDALGLQRHTRAVNVTRQR